MIVHFYFEFVTIAVLGIADNQPENHDEFVSAATSLFPDEAEVAISLLRSAGILCYLENEHTLAKVWQLNIALGGLRVMVPASLAAQIQEILSEVVSEEDLNASPEADAQHLLPSEPTSVGIFSRGRVGAGARAMLAVAVLCAPSIETLRLLYVGT